MSAHNKNWLRVDLGDDHDARSALRQLMLRVEVILEEVESLPGAAIFSKLENDCSIHCRTVVYLSPLLAGKLAGQLGAPCGVPPRKALSLLYGSDDAWALLDVVDL